MRVAAALKDDETNQRCATLIAGLPRDWLAYKTPNGEYAIRAPDGKCFSGKEEAKRYARKTAPCSEDQVDPRSGVVNFWSLGVEQLKTQLRYRHLPVSGRKDVLLGRLIDDDKQLPLQARSILLRSHRRLEQKEKEKQRQEALTNMQFAVATRTYLPTSESGKLSFQTGDVIVLNLSLTGNGWMMGCKLGKEDPGWCLLSYLKKFDTETDAKSYAETLTKQDI